MAKRSNPDNAERLFNFELARLYNEHRNGHTTPEQYNQSVREAYERAGHNWDDRESLAELGAIERALQEAEITEEEADTLRSEVKGGAPRSLQFKLARLALLPALATWAVAYQPGLVPQGAMALAIFSLLILWVGAILILRPPRSWWGGLLAFLSGPVLILIAGLLQGKVPGTFVFLYCMVEALAMPIGGISILVAEERHRERREFGKFAAIIGAPLLLIAVITPSTSVNWEGLTATELVLAAIALVAAAIANARVRPLTIDGVTPIAFRSWTGVAWLTLGFMIFPVIGAVIGHVMRTRGL